MINAICPPPPIWLDAKQVSTLTGVKTQTIYNHAVEGRLKLPILKRDGKYVCTRKALAEYLDGLDDVKSKPKPRKTRSLNVLGFCSELIREIDFHWDGKGEGECRFLLPFPCEETDPTEDFPVAE